MRHCHRVVLFYRAIAGIIKYRLGLCISRRGGGAGGGKGLLVVLCRVRGPIPLGEIDT